MSLRIGPLVLVSCILLDEAETPVCTVSAPPHQTVLKHQSWLGVREVAPSVSAPSPVPVGLAAPSPPSVRGHDQSHRGVEVVLANTSPGYLPWQHMAYSETSSPRRNLIHRSFTLLILGFTSYHLSIACLRTAFGAPGVIGCSSSSVSIGASRQVHSSSGTLCDVNRVR